MVAAALQACGNSAQRVLRSDVANRENLRVPGVEARAIRDESAVAVYMRDAVRQGVF